MQAVYNQKHWPGPEPNSVAAQCSSNVLKVKDAALAMTTHFITAEIDLQASSAETQKAIEAELAKRGEPLRWAVAQVDNEQNKVQVEAVVTTDATP